MQPSVVYPSVFVVDGQVPRVPVMQRQKSGHLRLQPVLILLVVLALTGLAVEAYFLKVFQEELQTLTSQVSKRVNLTFEKVIQDQKLKCGRPAAHLTGASNTALGEEALLWEQKNGEAFLHEIGYESITGSLVFNRSGHYFLYSKVQLGVLMCQLKNKKHLFYTHGIYKRSLRYPAELSLMVNLNPYCNQGTEQWWDSSFLGGTFQLDEQDEVFVKVDRKDFVRIKDGTRSYFGVFMI